jgi:pimeloyl-ACP methyl ester carboxylesterase
VLVAGAWYGGWVWRKVISRLNEMGHIATAPTLTGLGERRHNGADDTDLATHIEDVRAHIEMEDLHDVTLVGWSYGGMVITGVAGQISERIKSLIYVDAFVPEFGKAVVDYLHTSRRSNIEALMTANKPYPPIPLEVLGVTDPSIVDFVLPRVTDQPWRTFCQPLRASPQRRFPMAYVYCSGWPLTSFTQFYDQFKNDPAVRTAVIDTGHVCMLTEAQKTAELLVDLA